MLRSEIQGVHQHQPVTKTRPQRPQPDNFATSYEKPRPSPGGLGVKNFSPDKDSVTLSESALERQKMESYVQKILDQIQSGQSNHIDLRHQNGILTEKDRLTICEALVQNPNITSVELSGHKMSEQILKKLADNKNLKSLKLSNCMIGDLGARILAKSNTITSLDLSSNKIGDLGAGSFVQSNTITSLDLSSNHLGISGARHFLKNSTLTTLVLKGNDITQDSLKAIEQHISKNNSIYRIVNQQMPKANESVMSNTEHSVPQNKSPTVVDNNINTRSQETVKSDKSDVQEILNKIYEGNNSHIHAADRNLSNKDIQDICEAIKQNKSVTSLDISGNKSINLETAKALANNSCLTALSMSHTGIGDKEVKMLSTSQTLKFLNVSGNNDISSEGAKDLASNDKLNALIIRHCPIGYGGIEALADNKILTFLDVASCNSTKSGIDRYDNAIRALANNKTLKTLDISDMRIGKDVSLLLENSTITSLGISHTVTSGYQDKVSTDLMNALIEGLEKNKTITALQVGGNHFSEGDIVRLADSLSKHDKVTALDLSRNTHTALDSSKQRNYTEALSQLGADALNRCKKLTHLNLYMTGVDSQGSKTLLSSPSLTSLYLKPALSQSAEIESISEEKLLKLVALKGIIMSKQNRELAEKSSIPLLELSTFPSNANSSIFNINANRMHKAASSILVDTQRNDVADEVKKCLIDLMLDVNQPISRHNDPDIQMRLFNKFGTLDRDTIKQKISLDSTVSKVLSTLSAAAVTTKSERANSIPRSPSTGNTTAHQR